MIKGLLKVEDRCPGIMMIIFSINDSIPIINLFYLAVYQDKAKKMRALQRYVLRGGVRTKQKN